MPDLSEALLAHRRSVADGILSRFVFEHPINENFKRWTVEDGEPDRYYTVVHTDDPTCPKPIQAQFNVWFAPGTAVVVDVYEGDWHECR